MASRTRERRPSTRAGPSASERDRFRLAIARRARIPHTAVTMLHRHVTTELPGPRARQAMERGGFDMQSIYRALVIDDERSQGAFVVDVDGNVLLDLFANFALGALGYNHPKLVAAASTAAFGRAAINPTSTPFLTTEAWFDFLEGLER